MAEPYKVHSIFTEQELGPQLLFLSNNEQLSGQCKKVLLNLRRLKLLLLGVIVRFLFAIMSTIPEIPGHPIDFEADHALIEKLYTIAKADERRKQVVVKTYVVHNKPLSPLTSWNMRESVYKKKNPEFPTKARGLFTVGDKGKYKVVVRGYDKFFNVGETAETQVRTHIDFTRRIRGKLICEKCLVVID